MSEALDIEALCARYGPMVLRRCRRLLRDDDEAMDMCQEAFVRLIEQRDRLEARFPSSLLFTIATNLCLNRIRDRRRQAAPTDDRILDRIASLDEPAGASHARLLLDKLFRRQPESSRTIAVLHYLDGMTLEQVAQTVGMSVSGVRKRLRALRFDLTEMSQ